MEQYQQKLKKQLGFLRRSCQLYDKGEVNEVFVLQCQSERSSMILATQPLYLSLWDLYEKVMANRRKMAEGAEHARQQQLERLRYQADPDNRLVTAELERRWEEVLRELRRAEESENAGRRAAECEDGSAPRRSRLAALAPAS